MNIFKEKTLVEKIISTVSGTIIMITSIYLYTHGYPNNYVMAAGIYGLLKMI